jgi:hypothetical protein
MLCSKMWPKNVHIDDRRVGRIPVGVGARLGVVIVADAAKVLAGGVRHVERLIEQRIYGEQPAVVAGDIELGAAVVDGAEQRAEGVPDRPRPVRIPVLVGLLQRRTGQELAVLGKGDEQDSIEQPLRGGEHQGRRHGRIRCQERLEQRAPEAGVLLVIVLGGGLAAARRLLEQRVQVRPDRWRHHAIGAQEEHEPRVGALVGRQLRDREPLKGALGDALEVEPDLAEVGDQDPVARQVDRVAVGLVHRRPGAASERSIERIAGALALEGRHEPRAVAAQLPQHGVSILAVDLDVLLSRQGIAAACIACSWPAVPQHVAENIREKIGEQLLLVELLAVGALEERDPLGHAAPGADGRGRQGEGGQVRAHHVRPEQRRGLDRHVRSEDGWGGVRRPRSGAESA